MNYQNSTRTYIGNNKGQKFEFLESLNIQQRFLTLSELSGMDVLLVLQRFLIAL